MANAGSITVNVTTNLRETLARELRAAAETLDPQQGPPTAEDLRGTHADIDRLRAIVDGIREPSEEMVETVARVLNAHLYADREDDGRGFDRVTSDRRSAYLTAARRVLAAIGDA